MSNLSSWTVTVSMIGYFRETKNILRFWCNAKFFSVFQPEVYEFLTAIQQFEEPAQICIHPLGYSSNIQDNQLPQDQIRSDS